MSLRLRNILVGASLVAVALLVGVPRGGAHHAVLKFNLEEMTATADRVFIGRCLAVEETSQFIAQGDMPVTRFTFEVERAIKGKVPKQLTFTQLGHAAHRGFAKGGEAMMHGRPVSAGLVHGMTEFRVGDRAVLFLIPNYLGDKVTYPVGLYQGAFFISRMPSGQELVRNSINNLGLFTSPYNGTAMKPSEAKIIVPDADQPTEELAKRRGALPLDAFVSLVERIVGAHGDERGGIVGPQKGAIQQ
jgi:hypothetical protein